MSERNTLTLLELEEQQQELHRLRSRLTVLRDEIQNYSVTSVEVENEEDKLETSIEKLQNREVDELHEKQKELNSLCSQLSNLQIVQDEMQIKIGAMEAENEEKRNLLARIGKLNDSEIAELDEKIFALKSKYEEYENELSNLRQANTKEAEEECDNVTTDNAVEIANLEDEKQELENAYLELQKGTEELNAQNNLLESEINGLSLKMCELKSKLAVVDEECNTYNEKIEALEAEHSLMKVELDILKGKVGSQSSEGNSLFSEVEDSRQQLKCKAKEQKEQLIALQKTHSQMLLDVRKLMKENAKMSEELEHAKERKSTEEMQVQLAAYKQRIKEIEAAQKMWEVERASVPFVRSQDGEMENFYNNLLREEREKTKQVWERYEDIMARYLAATDEVAALNREAAAMESMKLHAEAEIAKLKLELLKDQEDAHKKYILELIEQRHPFKEIQNIRKNQSVAETVGPSARKCRSLKEVDK